MLLALERHRLTIALRSRTRGRGIAALASFTHLATLLFRAVASRLHPVVLGLAQLLQLDLLRVGERDASKQKTLRPAATPLETLRSRAVGPGATSLARATAAARQQCQPASRPDPNPSERIYALCSSTWLMLLHVIRVREEGDPPDVTNGTGRDMSVTPA
jgi:hypothetical protein